MSVFFSSVSAVLYVPIVSCMHATSRRIFFGSILSRQAIFKRFVNILRCARAFFLFLNVYFSCPILALAAHQLI